MRFKPFHKKSHESRNGQIAIVLLLMLLGLVFLTLVNVDVFLSVRGKNRLQNAGDSAALAAARWQGITLNAIGALNLSHIDIACNPAYYTNPDVCTNLCARITALQERISFAGPMMAVYAAQRAAMKNHIGQNDEMTALVNEIISRASSEIQPTPAWASKPQDFRSMLQQVTADGIYAGIDNAGIVGAEQMSAENSQLFNMSFYAAVDGEDWCWFYFLGGETPDAIQNFTNWGDVDNAAWSFAVSDPAFFGTHIRPQKVRFLKDGYSGVHAEAREIIEDLAKVHGLENVNSGTLEASGILTNQFDHTWFFYDPAEWDEWNEMDIGGESGMPLKSEVKDEYDVYGACAAARCIMYIDPLTPDVSRKKNLWVGAAKPFGYRETYNGKSRVTKYSPDPDSDDFMLITPDFRDVRLIPLGGVNEGRLNMSDKAWVTHTRDHIEGCAGGITFDGCPYCNILKKWNDPEFRNRGVMWLIENGKEQCRRPTGPGTWNGGTRHAH